MYEGARSKLPPKEEEERGPRAGPRIDPAGVRPCSRSGGGSSGGRGGENHVSMEKMRAKKPEFIIEHAVKGMLPRNKLGRAMLKKLKIHSGAEHPYEAQQPKPLV